MSSQVVESVKEMIEFYTNTFEEVSSVACLDDTLFTKTSRAVTWEKGIHTIYYTDKEFEEYLKENILNLNEIKEIKDQSIRKEIIHNDSAYIIKGYEVYIGEIL